MPNVSNVLKIFDFQDIPLMPRATYSNFHVFQDPKVRRVPSPNSLLYGAMEFLLRPQKK